MNPLEEDKTGSLDPTVWPLVYGAVLGVFVLWVALLAALPRIFP